MQVLYKTMLIVTKAASRNLLSGTEGAGESLNAFTDYAIENVTENSLSNALSKSDCMFGVCKGVVWMYHPFYFLYFRECSTQQFPIAHCI